MANPKQEYQGSHEIGRIYDAITDSKVLCDFYLSTVLQFVPAKKGYLFLTGKNKKLVLEATTPLFKEAPEWLLEACQRFLNLGKPEAKDRLLFLPVIARNNAMGIVCFERGIEAAPFTKQEVKVGYDLTSEFSGALKNILLFEDNLKMERLAGVGQAMGMVIHEIKNIMQLARFSDEMIRMGLKEKNEKFLDKGLAKMAKTLKEIDGFIGEMLSLTKEYQIEPEPMNIPALLEELCSDLDEKAQGLHVRLDFKAEAGFPEVQGDTRALYRALLNLVKNALEAFQDKSEGCIKIRAHVKGMDHYEILVEDNGSGMSEETRSKLFQAFFSTKGKRGTGLGLMVVARTVNMHLGEVKVESQIGLGTRFILTLPQRFTK